jgi:hypothetical protein
VKTPPLSFQARTTIPLSERRQNLASSPKGLAGDRESGESWRGAALPSHQPFPPSGPRQRPCYLSLDQDG